MGLATYEGDGEAALDKGQELGTDIRRNLRVAGGLRIFTVNPEGGQDFLGVAGEDGCEIDRAGALRIGDANRVWLRKGRKKSQSV